MEIPRNIDYFDSVHMVSKSYTKLMIPICEKWELTRNEVDVLLFLYNNPKYKRAADIVAHRGIAKSHVSLSVANLEKRGFLLRQFPPADRRTFHLVLTDQGLSVAQEARELQEQFLESLYAGVTETEFAVWQGIAEKIQKNIQELDKSLG